MIECKTIELFIDKLFAIVEIAAYEVSTSRYTNVICYTLLDE